MKVGISISRLIVVDDDVDSLDIDSSSEDVGADKDSLLESLELLVPLDSAKVQRAVVSMRSRKERKRERERTAGPE